MKLTANSEALTKVLGRAILSSGANVNPIHALVKLEARSEPPSLVVSATSGTMQLNTSILAKVDQPGIIAANTKQLLNAATNMPGGGTTLTADDKHVRLTGSNGRRWSGSLADPTFMGPLPEPVSGDHRWLEVPVDAMRRGLARVAHVMRDIRAEEIRSAWNGVRVEATRDELITVSATKRICATFAQKAAMGLKVETWKATIPSIAITQLKDILDEASEEEKPTINLYENDSLIFIVGPTTLVAVCPLLGDFLPWQLIMSNFPKEPHATLARIPLIESLKACKATSSRLDPSAIYLLERDNVSILRKDPENEYSDTVPVVTMRPNMKLSMKSDIGYMVDCLSAADEDPEFSIGDDANAILLRTSTGYRALVGLMAFSPGEV